MKRKVITSGILIVVAPVHTNATASNGPVSYLIGGIIAVLIMGYLVYTLIRPEKF
jgi:K+-transporting ATPase KdpF subunit